MTILTSDATVDIPVASVGYVTYESVINTNTHITSGLSSVSWEAEDVTFVQ
jgi:hypothetical protein